MRESNFIQISRHWGHRILESVGQDGLMLAVTLQETISFT